MQAANANQPALLRDVAADFAKCLRRHGGRSGLDAVHFFNIQLAAVAYVITHDGLENGSKLSDALHLAAGAPSSTSAEMARLEAGFHKALCGHVNSAAASKKCAHLQAALPWLRGSNGQFLSANDAKNLHRELSSRFGSCVLRGAVSKFESTMRVFLTALQPLGNIAPSVEPKRKAVAWRIRFAREARRRVKQRSHNTVSLPTPSEWLEKRHSVNAATPYGYPDLSTTRKRPRLDRRPGDARNSGVADRRSDCEHQAVLPSTSSTTSDPRPVLQPPRKSARTQKRSSAAAAAPQPGGGEARHVQPAPAPKLNTGLSGLRRSSACIDLDKPPARSSDEVDAASSSVQHARRTEAAASPNLPEPPQVSVPPTRQWRLRRFEE